MRRLCLLLTSLAALSCGSKDTPQTPPPGDGDGEVVVVDASDVTAWTADIRVTGRGEWCSSMSESSTDIHEVWQSGVFRSTAHTEGSPVSASCCMNRRQDATIRSARTYDLTPYHAARVQCRIRVLSTYYQGWEGVHRATFTVRSNVPGSPDLNMFIKGVNPPYEDTVDLSLANALTYQEATFELLLQAGGYCGGEAGSWIGGDVSVEVLDFKVVGER